MDDKSAINGIWNFGIEKDLFHDELKKEREKQRRTIVRDISR